ncbi:MAG TPA: HD domain-containing protein [Acidimicrobiales bacterium]
MNLPPVRLSERFRGALDVAAWAHEDQLRKSTNIPYVGHLLAVCALVVEAGGDEDQAIAALLHDTLEDQPHKVNEELLRERFGAEVARIVVACTDTTEVPKPPWRPRKEAYLATLGHHDERVLLVSLADKLHNATALRRDLEAHGASVWDRFNAGAPQQLWYLRSLLAIYEQHLQSGPPAALVRELRDEVAKITDLAGG